MNKFKCQKVSKSVFSISKTKSRHFYGTEDVIWAGFGPVGNTEKNGPIMSNF